MGINIGNINASALYLGSAEITKVYQGAIEIYSAAPVAAPYIIEVNTQNAGSAADTFILPTFGAGFDFTVDWGDNVVETYQGTPGNITHQYATAGIYDIEINGLFPHISFANTGDRLKLLKVKQWGGIQWGSFLRAYEGCSNINITATDAPILTNVTNMEKAFSRALSVSTTHDFNAWDVSSVTDMQEMFRQNNFNRPIGNWDVSSVTDMQGMFMLSSFNQDISNWNVGNVTNMGTMFRFGAFNQDISGWDVSSVTDMQGMFMLSSLNQDISGWDVSNVTNMSLMFANNTGFNQLIGNWDVSNVTNMSNMFRRSAYNQDLGAWVIKGPTLSGIFETITTATGMSTENYSRTLIGWANTVFANGNLPININMITQTSRTFNNTQFTTGNQFNDAVSARNYLLTTCNWNITGDTQV